MIKRMYEDARLKELDYTGLETLQFVEELQDPSLREVCLRMLDTHVEEAKLTKEDLVSKCENFTALKMDDTDIEGSHDVYVVQKKNVKCFNSGGPHCRSTCPLLSSNTGQNMRQKPRRRSNRRKRSQCKNVVTFAAENAQTYLDVNIRGRSLRFQLDTGADIMLVSRRVRKKLESPALEACIMLVKTADGSPMKIDGSFSTDFFVRNRTTEKNIQGDETCYVTESTNLPGLEWCIQLPAYKELKDKYRCRMMTKEKANREETIADLKKQYADVFKCGVGRWVRTKAKLLLRDNAVPVFKEKRPLPYAFVSDLDAEIDRLIVEEVISPVEHSEWATPIVVVKKKSGQICLCEDFSTGLNGALQLHQHLWPLIPHFPPVFETSRSLMYRYGGKR
ncbi:hypothetical protein RB195_023847 [Necator americanus]|uniref:Peptidase A2 domain-containing protein n=1 Tax=Necator americanus TaxID=51031 RepID=A0ABR1EKV3_NECAM